MKYEGRFDIFSGVLLDNQGLAAMSKDGDIYTDDRPTLEFTAPRRLGSVGENIAMIIPYLAPLSRIFTLPDRTDALLTRLRALNLDMLRYPGEGRLIREEIGRVREELYSKK